MKLERISDIIRIINVKLAYGDSILKEISAHAPQVGFPHEENSQFKEHNIMEQIMRNIKPDDEILIGAVLNGHVGRGRSVFEQEHGCHSFRDINEEVEDVLIFVQPYNVGNTFCQKQEDHLVTY